MRFYGPTSKALNVENKSMEDITSLHEIKILVNAFYAKVRKDDLIGEVFNHVIKDRWALHLEKMYGFWQTVLLNEPTYSGSPFPPHAQLPVEKKHFERWIFLFKTTVDENFAGENADAAKWRAEKMAQMFHFKINYLNQQAKNR